MCSTTRRRTRRPAGRTPGWCRATTVSLSPRSLRCRQPRSDSTKRAASSSTTSSSPFSAEDDFTPQEVHAIGLEFAQRQFPDFEVVVATYVDTSHLHNHLVVNSVSCKDGHKLHQSYSDLLDHRKVNDEICLAHGLKVLQQPERREKKKRMTPGEYRAGLYGESWKLDLIQAINEALEYADDRESFIASMEVEGYQVRWEPNRKYITFTCPNRRKCRDSSLHDETFLKENLEMLFVYRQARLPALHPGTGRTGRRVVPGGGGAGARRAVAVPRAAHLDRQQASTPGGIKENGHGAEVRRQSRTWFWADPVIQGERDNIRRCYFLSPCHKMNRKGAAARREKAIVELPIP